MSDELLPEQGQVDVNVSGEWKPEPPRTVNQARRQGRRWRLESWNKKRETWDEEASWHDGNNANGTPRLDRAIKEARELIDAGMTVRIFDLWDCTAHYIITDRGIAPN